MDFNALFTLFFAIALLAAKPGPGMMTVATKAMGEGLGSATAFISGTALAKIVFFTLVVLGYRLIEDTAALFSVVLKSLTAAYLIWLGVRGFLKAVPEAQPEAIVPRKAGMLENMTAGFMLTISNPFDILFFTGILPTILTIGSITPGQYIACAAVIVMAYATVALSYAVPISLSRRFISWSLLRKLNLVSSIGIVLVGLYIAYSAIFSVM